MHNRIIWTFIYSYFSIHSQVLMQFALGFSLKNAFWNLHIIVYRFLLSLREFYQTLFYLIDLTSWPTEGHLGFFYTVLQWKSLYRSNLCLTSVQFSSVAQLCPTLCDPMNHSTPSLPVHHQLSEFTQIKSSESVMPSNHLILCHPLNLSQHQGLFKWVSSSHHVDRVLEFQLQHQSFQWIFRTDLL